MQTIETHAEPRIRTIKLRSALAVGAAVVVGAFGAGYAVAEALGEPVGAAAAPPSVAVGHAFSAGLAESLVLKHRSTEGG